MSVSSNNNLAALQAATYTKPDTAKAKPDGAQADKSSTAATSTEQSKKPEGLGSISEAKQQLNASIIQASLSVSITSGNDSLALLYKTAIENINDVLKPELGENAIQKAAENGDDHTPEGTSARILGFVAALYEMYRDQKVTDGEEFDEAALAEKFVGIVGGGVDKGFNEAKKILTGLGVFEGDIESNANKTYDLVKQGLQLFIDSKKPKETAETDTTTPQAQDAAKTDAAADSKTKV